MGRSSGAKDRKTRKTTFKKIIDTFQLRERPMDGPMDSLFKNCLFFSRMKCTCNLLATHFRFRRHIRYSLSLSLSLSFSHQRICPAEVGLGSGIFESCWRADEEEVEEEESEEEDEEDW